jgi:hypothetical protein
MVSTSINNKKSGCQSTRTNPTCPSREKWNMNRFASADGEADVQPSLSPEYSSMVQGGCQEEFSPRKRQIVFMK